MSDAEEIEDWLLKTGHLDQDSGMLFIGPETERRYGAVHYRDLMAVFTADPEVQIFFGREQVGSVDPMLLLRKVSGPRLITLTGRAWEVTYIDWKRHKAYVEPTRTADAPRWQSMPQAQSWALSDAIGRVLLGATPVGVSLTRRAEDRIALLREEFSDRVVADRTVLAENGARMRWWTWAGARANAVLVAAIDHVAPDMLGESITYDNWQIALRGDATGTAVSQALARASQELGAELESAVPLVDEEALKHLKFSKMLPREMAVATLSARLADRRSAVRTGRRPIVTVHAVS